MTFHLNDKLAYTFCSKENLLHPNLFFIRLIRISRISQIAGNMCNHFFSSLLLYLYFRKDTFGQYFSSFLIKKSIDITVKQV